MRQIIFIFSVICLSSTVFCQGAGKKKYDYTDSLGRRQGFWRCLSPTNSERFNLYEGIYYNDVQIGVWTLKTQDGVILKQDIFFDTIMHKVEYVEYFKNQGVKSIGFKYKVAYKDTVYPFGNEPDSMNVPIYIDSILMKQGKWIYYYENGEMESEGQYKDDQKKGVWKYYNEKGELLKTEEY